MQIQKINNCNSIQFGKIGSKGKGFGRGYHKSLLRMNHDKTSRLEKNFEKEINKIYNYQEKTSQSTNLSLFDAEIKFYDNLETLLNQRIKTFKKLR